MPNDRKERTVAAAAADSAASENATAAAPPDVSDSDARCRRRNVGDRQTVRLTARQQLAT